MAFMTGMKIQPRMAPIHQASGVLPRASTKFSVLIEKRRALHMTRTRLLGGGASDTSTLPTRVASPAQVLTIPRMAFPPFFLDNNMAGSAALYMEATRLIAARNKIRSRIPRFLCKYCNPFFAEIKRGSAFEVCPFPVSGIVIKLSLIHI